MDIGQLAPLAAFAFATSISPGPNNLMIMTSVSLFGLRATFPHIAGVVVGFNVMLAATVLGLGSLINQAEIVATVIRATGSAWLIWLGLQLCWNAPQVVNSTDQKDPTRHRAARPLTSWEAALFQWANPKALAMAMSSAAVFGGVSAVLLVRLSALVAVFALVGLATSLIWALLGSLITQWINTGRRAAATQFFMGILYMGTAIALALA